VTSRYSSRNLRHFFLCARTRAHYVGQAEFPYALARARARARMYTRPAAALSGVSRTRDGPRAGKSLLAARTTTRNGVSNAGKELAGAINARKEILFVRSKYTRTHDADEAVRSPGCCGLSGTTASGTPQSSRYPGRMHRAVGVAAPLFRGGTSGQASLTEKTHSSSCSERAESRKPWRGGAAHRGPLVKILFTSVAMAVPSRATLRPAPPYPSAS
jgi:hypothetical protein